MCPSLCLLRLFTSFNPLPPKSGILTNHSLFKISQGGSWWVVSATAGQIIVTGNEALEFPAQGNIQLYRNETDLGVYPYTSVKNLQGYKFAFDSDVMAFPTSFVPDAVSNTQLLV